MHRIISTVNTLCIDVPGLIMNMKYFLWARQEELSIQNIAHVGQMLFF